jgi:hypothetical protein
MIHALAWPRSDMGQALHCRGLRDPSQKAAPSRAILSAHGGIDMAATSRQPTRIGLMAATLVAGLLALGGCATSAVNAQWSDPQFAGKSLRGSRVFVACQASDLTLRRVCADRMAAKLSALGAVPVMAPDGGDPGSNPPNDTEALLQAARGAGTVALWRTTVVPEVAVASPGPSIGIGIGGFGGGYRSVGGVGFGVSAPLGGAGAVETGYGASASLIDVASGKLMWSARATAAPSSDVGQQLATLATLLLDSARQAGLFPA